MRILAYVYLIKQGRLAARGPKPLTRSTAKTANATNLKESCPLKPSLEDSNETSDPWRVPGESWVLFHTSRILDGQPIADEGEILGEVKSLHFARPVVDCYSPVAYPIMTYVNQGIACHENPVVVLRKLISLTSIFKGRDLANKIAKACISCRRFKLRWGNNTLPHSLLLQLLSLHKSTLLDLGWQCVSIIADLKSNWALLFQCPATSALAAILRKKLNI